MKTAGHFLLISFLLAVVAHSTGCAVSDKAVMAQADNAHTGIEPAVMDDPELSQYMQKVGNRIIDVAEEMHAQKYGPAGEGSEDASWMFGKDMKFHLVNSKTLNAFTTGGNHMYIYSALFLNCKSEDELAGVMAHEYGHVYGRHVHSGMQRQYAILGTAVAAGAGGYALGGKDKGAEYATYAASAAMLGGNFFGMKFNRDDESEADAIGFDFYVRAGWDPDKFADFFKQMIEQGHAQADDTFSTHPAAQKRVDAAEERAEDLPPSAKQWRRKNVASESEFAQLQARSRKVAANSPSDETLAQAQKLLSAFPSCVSPVDQPDQVQARQDLQKDLEKKSQEAKVKEETKKSKKRRKKDAGSS